MTPHLFILLLTTSLASLLAGLLLGPRFSPNRAPKPLGERARDAGGGPGPELERRDLAVWTIEVRVLEDLVEDELVQELETERRRRKRLEDRLEHHWRRADRWQDEYRSLSRLWNTLVEGWEPDELAARLTHKIATLERRLGDRRFDP